VADAHPPLDGPGARGAGPEVYSDPPPPEEIPARMDGDRPQPPTAASGGGPVPPAGPNKPDKQRRTRRTILEWGAVLLVAVLAAVLLRSFVIQPYFIPSGSMEPTLQIKDKVLVDKLSYHLHNVHRGDVIVFKRPPNYDDPGVKDLIKRVIGLPGETISGCDNGQVCINGRVLPQPWLPKQNAFTRYFPPVHIPAGHYFVMGDNRGDSDDSRFGLGPISENLIVGRAFLIVWPLGHFGTL
jgi:signal peptidase I